MDKRLFLGRIAAISAASAALFAPSTTFAQTGASMCGVCPCGMTAMTRPRTGTLYCVGTMNRLEGLRGERPSSSGAQRDGGGAAAPSHPYEGRHPGRQSHERTEDFRTSHGEWNPQQPTQNSTGSTNGFLSAAPTSPTSCEKGFVLKPQHMLSSEMYCAPINCDDLNARMGNFTYVLHNGECVLNGHTPEQIAARTANESAGLPSGLVCPSDSTPILHSAGYTWLCKPNNAAPFSGESQWPVAHNPTFEAINALSVGHGCSPVLEWTDPAKGGHCRLELGVGFPLDDKGNIKSGFSQLMTRYNEGSQGSAMATCKDGVWTYANATCDANPNSFYTGAVPDVMADVRAQSAALIAAADAAAAAAYERANAPIKAQKVADLLAIARNPNGEINARLQAFGEAHILLHDGKTATGMGPRCTSAVLAAQKSEGEIMSAAMAIRDNPKSSIDAIRAASEQILSIHMSATGAGGTLRGPIKALCDAEFNEAMNQ